LLGTLWVDPSPQNTPIGLLSPEISLHSLFPASPNPLRVTLVRKDENTDPPSLAFFYFHYLGLLPLRMNDPDRNGCCSLEEELPHFDSAHRTRSAALTALGFPIVREADEGLG